MLGVTSCSKDTTIITKNEKATTELNPANQCGEPENDPLCTKTYNILDSIFLSGCWIKYTYNTKKCADGGIVWGLEIQAFGDSTGTCANFVGLIDSYIQSNNISALRNLYNIIYSKVSFKVEQSFASTFQSQDHQCSNGALNFSTNFVSTACIEICIEKVKGKTRMTEKSCGESCCTRTTVWCYEGSQLTELYQTYGPGQTCGNTGPTTGCNGFSLPCAYSCDRIYPIE